jgi:guanine deaminase
MSDLSQTILGPILIPRAGGNVDFIPEGALSCDATGTIDYVDSADSLPPPALATARKSRKSRGLILPPFLDAHIHIPQNPIRGHFMDGVKEKPPEGRLIAGLNRNVFPAEARCAESEIARQVVRDFARDTLSQGVVGGAAYMTVHPAAADIALAGLHEFWSVGLVLMEMNCPEYLRVDPSKVIDQIREIAQRFGRRCIVTDRFAVAVGSELRRAASRLARDMDLLTQTHLNEQVAEKRLVEHTLYPGASYTEVYRRDGLLDVRCILAHCIQMTDAELAILARQRPLVAHCPTSNTLLCSGVMPLDRTADHGIDYAICTDVGASPTTSLLAEMAQFLKVHEGRSRRATPSEALYRTTLAPAAALGVDVGALESGRPMSFIEVACTGSYGDADDAIRRGLLELPDADVGSEHRAALDDLASVHLDVGPRLTLLEDDVRATAARLENKVQSVTLAGREIWRRDGEKSV